MDPAPAYADSSFATELATFEQRLAELLADAGRFVLIQGHDVAGVFDSYQDAVTAGYERFKLQRFLVKQITPVQRISFFGRDLKR